MKKLLVIAALCAALSGGAARGISGPGAWGYLAGNGLTTATVLGRIAGRSAARLVAGR